MVQPVARVCSTLSEVIPRPGQLLGQLLVTWRADRDGNGGAPNSGIYRRTRKNYGGGCVAEKSTVWIHTVDE